MSAGAMKSFLDRAVKGNSMRCVALALLCASVASCATTSQKTAVVSKKHSKEYFAETEYGVKASPRVHVGANVPKGGGRYQVGKPYQVKGKWYYPKEDFKYNKVGLASWYGSAFHGRQTANGEVYDQYHISAAHPTFPLPSYARVTNVDNGTSVIVRVNDRGPYHPGRIIDLSDKAADLLDMKTTGTAKVRVQYVGRARMDGEDMPYLMASYQTKGSRTPRFDPQIATGVMVASNETSIGLPDLSTQASAATALSETKQTKAFDGFPLDEQFASLPEFGPYPEDRPELMYDIASGSSIPVSGYAAFRIQQAASPFDSILVAAPRLDASAIRAAHARNAKNER